MEQQKLLTNQLLALQHAQEAQLKEYLARTRNQGGSGGGSGGGGGGTSANATINSTTINQKSPNHRVVVSSNEAITYLNMEKRKLLELEGRKRGFEMQYQQDPSNPAHGNMILSLANLIEDQKRRIMEAESLLSSRTSVKKNLYSNPVASTSTFQPSSSSSSSSKINNAISPSEIMGPGNNTSTTSVNVNTMQRPGSVRSTLINRSGNNFASIVLKEYIPLC